MNSTPFSRRVLAQLRLALLADCGCDETLAKLDDNARMAGLTGAEIDAALDGKSFEARTAAALAFACAVKTGDHAYVALLRKRAVLLGITDNDLRLFETEVYQIVANGPKA